MTEHQERCLSCEHCGRETYAGASLPLGESRFGPRLHAVVVSLNLESRLSFLTHEDQLWTFLQHPTMPIHNKDQESALRPLVIKRKLSFSNNTTQGVDRLAQLMSIIETLKRQGRDVYSWFISALQGKTTLLLPTPHRSLNPVFCWVRGRCA